MAGRPGRSGGWNRLSPEEHVLRGTHNRTRHGSKPAVLTVAALPKPGPVPDAVIAGLSGRGLAFVQRAWAAYDGWNPQSLELLREAGFLLSQIETVRGTDDERPAQRLLLATLAALRLED
jgi:hypothetical protein